MPSISIIGDIHTCGATDINGSQNVFANNLPVHRLGDFHSHGSIQIQGSPNVFANNLPIARHGDLHGGCPTNPPHPPAPEVSFHNVKLNGD